MSYNSLDHQYQYLLQDIIDNGIIKENRNGATSSVFGRTLRHNMREGFPVLTTKKMAWLGIVSELLWFLRGQTNIQPLVQQGNSIWTGDAYKAYCKQPQFLGHEDVPSIFEFERWIKTDDEFAEKYGELGPVYGHSWRNWGGETKDELYENYLKKVQSK